MMEISNDVHDCDQGGGGMMLRLENGVKIAECLCGSSSNPSNQSMNVECFEREEGCEEHEWKMPPCFFLWQ